MKSPQTDLLQAFARDTGPLAKAVEAFLQNPSKEAADTLLADLPNLVPDDPALAAVIAEEMAKAMRPDASAPSGAALANEVQQCPADGGFKREDRPDVRP